MRNNKIMISDNEKMNQQYLRAKKRVEKIKGYYWHLTVYLVVNLFLSTNSIVHDIRGGDTFEEALFDFDNFELWLWWGIGLAFHTYKVFGAKLLFMDKDWEDRKIEEYMNEK